MTEQWTPVRYVRRPQTCAFCWCVIPAGSPGSSTGTRGTRAWVNDRGEWECLGCRSDGFRAEEARAKRDVELLVSRGSTGTKALP